MIKGVLEAKSSEHNFNCYTGSFTSHVENLKMFLLITTQVALEVAFIYFFLVKTHLPSGSGCFGDRTQ